MYYIGILITSIISLTGPIPYVIWYGAHRGSSSIAYTVKILISYTLSIINNQQITNNNNYLVGISETTRVKTIKFNQWLGGLIDANGNFKIINKINAQCEIIVSINDEKLLRQIQNKYGGSIKLRSGNKTLRYRLINNNIKYLIKDINGNIHTNKRLVELHKICNILNISVLRPVPLDKDNGWFNGYFDGKGIIEYNISTKPQINISVTSRLYGDIEVYKDIWGGDIRFDPGNNGSYRWDISRYIDIIQYYNYNKVHPSRSTKFKRLILIKEFYRLIELDAYKASSGLLHKAWLLFTNKW